MKIFAVARNYAAHAKELNNKIPNEPVLFMKPHTALILPNESFYYPEFSELIHYETELVLKVYKNGKHIEEKFAADYYQEITVGIDFTARDLQNKCKEKGWPWEIAKSFDRSAAVGDFVPKSEFADIGNINFSLQQNNTLVQKGNTQDLLFPIDTLVANISKYFTLNIGDLIFTGTPVGVGPIAIGDVLEGFLEGKQVLTCEVK